MILSTDLVEFLLLETPIEKQRRDGFMDIADVQYHENTISRIYAYFLNIKKNSAVADLFLNSLLQIIRRKSGKNLEFDNHFCQLERQTAKGNRIDMLIKTGNETFTKEDYALVIENKIFSSVHNDLLDYWETISIPIERKMGILLTLRTEPIPESVKAAFINVTHAEWMSEIRSLGLPYDLEPSLYIYLNDFIRNMEDIIIISSNAMNEDARFFFQHTGKVLRARKTYDAAWSHVVNQLKVLSEKLGLSLYGNSEGWRHIWDHESYVYYVFGFDQTLKENPRIRVILEVYKDAISRKDELRQMLTDAGYYIRLSDDNKSTQSWAHLAFLEYDLSPTELEHLGATLYEKIIRDFSGAYQLVHQALHGINNRMD